MAKAECTGHCEQLEVGSYVETKGMESAQFFHSPLLFLCGFEDPGKL